MNNSCDSGDIRIVGGESQLEGRVEVCLRGVWGTICGIDWTDLDAAVVCNQTGHAITGENSRETNQNGQFLGVLIFVTIKCVKNFYSLENCHPSPHLCTRDW